MGGSIFVIVAQVAGRGSRIVGEHVAGVGAATKVCDATEGETVSERRRGLDVKDLVLPLGLVH